MVIKIAIVGLGYVGLPLARLFATKYSVVGFDTSKKRVEELRQAKDTTLEVEEQTLKDVVKPSNNSENGLFLSDKLQDIQDCNYYIITVPTPVDDNKHPDLNPLYQASQSIGKILKKGDIVIYESTVYPGVTEEECVPILEQTSKLKFNTDFFVGYSPERTNPGDKEHTIEKVIKITSGSTPQIAKKINDLYRSVIVAGTHLAETIKVAEAAKVIENVQRDVNIALVNELTKIFNLLDIDTYQVLKAANTKWNFLPFVPGLVGGHCISVDPYYLAQKAQKHGYHPEIILAGRRLNDSMSDYIATQVVKAMLKKKINITKSDLLMLGITFKKNCTDIRNTKIVDLVNVLKDYGIKISILDPLANPLEVKQIYGLDSITSIGEKSKYDAIVLGVDHDEFLDLDLQSLKKENGIIYDVKGFLKQYDYRL